MILLTTRIDMAISSIGKIMIEKLQTIEALSSAEEAAKKMSDKNISSLLVMDVNDNNNPIGIPRSGNKSMYSCCKY
jgi:CBS domain-containing protein